ncbi:MAG: YhbY family RNA-binding protein [Clostridia bacterium]
MALTAKERKLLTGMGQKLEPIFQIGKNGLSDLQIREIGKALDTREIIKISILPNSDEDISVVMDSICKKLGAEPVSKVGKKLVIYRYSLKDKVNHIEF